MSNIFYFVDVHVKVDVKVDVKVNIDVDLDVDVDISFIYSTEMEQPSCGCDDEIKTYCSAVH